MPLDDTRASSEQLLPLPSTHNLTASEDSSDPIHPSAPFANMGLSISTARVVAPLSFLVDFACQQYGMMIAKPDMKQIHDNNPCSFSPQPFAIAGFFGPQQILQLLWLRELWRQDSEVERGTTRYAAWYSLGNACISVWMIFWTRNNLKGANIPVLINTITQTYYVFALRNKRPQTYQSKLTNVIAITFAGIGILDMFHNTTAAYFPGVAPNTLVQIGTALAGPLTALFSPLLFGACIAYDLFGVAIGQHQLAQKALTAAGGGGGGGEGWARLLGGVGLAVVGIIGARAYGGARWV